MFLVTAVGHENEQTSQLMLDHPWHKKSMRWGSLSPYFERVFGYFQPRLDSWTGDGKKVKFRTSGMLRYIPVSEKSTQFPGLFRWREFAFSFTKATNCVVKWGSVLFCSPLSWCCFIPQLQWWCTWQVHKYVTLYTVAVLFETKYYCHTSGRIKFNQIKADLLHSKAKVLCIHEDSPSHWNSIP